MERFGIEDTRLSDAVAAAEAIGEVAITRGGEVVATLTAAQPALPPHSHATTVAAFLRDLDELHRSLPPELLGGDAGEEVSRMRDEGVERLLGR